MILTNNYIIEEKKKTLNLERKELEIEIHLKKGKYLKLGRKEIKGKKIIQKKSLELDNIGAQGKNIQKKKKILNWVIRKPEVEKKFKEKENVATNSYEFILIYRKMDDPQKIETDRSIMELEGSDTMLK